MYKQFNVFAKIFLSIFLGFILFRVAILGTKAAKGRYLGRGLSKFVIGLLALTVAPLALSAFFGVFSDMIKSDEGYAKSAVDKIPSRYIVDDRRYIDTSLTYLKDKKNNDAVNGGYVLNHDNPDMPKTQKDVKIKYRRKT